LNFPKFETQTWILGGKNEYDRDCYYYAYHNFNEKREEFDENASTDLYNNILYKIITKFNRNELTKIQKTMINIYE